MQIVPEQVITRLQPLLGDYMAYRTPLCTALAEHMTALNPEETSLTEAAADLEREIFRRLHASLGEGMTVLTPSRSPRRIRMDQMADLADEALGVWMDALPVTRANHVLLKSYAMAAGSVSAMRTLLQRFAAYDSPEERRVMIRLLRSGYPHERTEAWLPED